MSTPFYLHTNLVDPATNTIVVGNVRHKIEPKILHVLLCLVEAEGKVVSKEELLATVWSDTVVVDMVLTRAISHLRSVLNDDATDPAYIDTISKKGYRLVAPVQKKPPRKLNLRLLLLVALLSVGFVFLILRFWSPKQKSPVSIQPFTTDKGWEYHPDVSSDGKWVAYVSKQELSFSIMVESLVSDSLVTIPCNGNCFKPRWSKDMGAVAYYSLLPGEQVKLNVYSFETNGLLHSIDTKARMAGMDWHPEKDAIIFNSVDPKSNKNNLFQLSLEDQKTTNLEITPKGVFGDLDPTFSPDGGYLAFVRTISEGNQDIYVWDSKEHTSRRVTSWNAAISGITWLNNTELLFSASHQWSAGLWKVHVDDHGVSEMLVLPYGQNVYNPTFRSGTLIGELWQQDTDLDFHPKEISSAFNTSLWELHPALSNDGSKIAFSSNRSGFYEIWVHDFARETTSQLSSTNGPFNGKPRWSLNDQYLAFETVSNGSSAIEIVEANTGALFKTILSTSDHINPTWSADGRCLYFASNQEGMWNIYKQEIQSDLIVQVTEEGGYLLQESAWPTPRKFYYSSEGNGIFELFPDGQSAKVISSIHPSDWGNWLIQGNNLYYYDRTQKAIIKYDLITSSEVVFHGDLENVPTNDPSFHYHQETGTMVIGKVNTYKGDLIKISNLF